MTIILRPSQENWLQARVAEGDFESVEAAALQLLDERIAEREFEEDDLAWLKPDVDKGLADLQRGNILSQDEYMRQMNAIRLL